MRMHSIQLVAQPLLAVVLVAIVLVEQLAPVVRKEWIVVAIAGVR